MRCFFIEAGKDLDIKRMMFLKRTLKGIKRRQGCKNDKRKPMTFSRLKAMRAEGAASTGKASQGRPEPPDPQSVLAGRIIRSPENIRVLGRVEEQEGRAPPPQSEGREVAPRQGQPAMV